MSNSIKSKEVDAALADITAGRTADDLESGTLDFKQDGRSDREAAKLLAAAAACLANADGGTLVLGVRDRVTGHDAIVGTEHTPD